MKTKIISHLQYKWWVYIAVILLPVIFWNILFDVISAPKDNEKIAFTVFDDGEFWNDAVEDLKLNKSEITDCGIKKITLETQLFSEDFIGSLLISRIITGDIIIFRENLLQNTEEGKFNPSGYFAPLPVSKMEELFGECGGVEFVLFEENAVGVYLNNPDDGFTNNFEKIYGGKERFAVFFSYESPNCGGIYGVGSASDTAATDFIKYWLSAAG